MDKPSLTLTGPKQASGVLRLPGSKSISNRALLMSALSGGTHLKNLLISDDTERMLDAFQVLGIEARLTGTNCEVLNPSKLEGFDANDEAVRELYLGNAGTAMRPLVSILAHAKGHFRLTGEPRMYERPIGPLVDALQQIGADIEYLGQPGYPPLLIRGKRLSGGQCELDASLSSQYISSLLMLLPILPEDSSLRLKGEIVSWPYVEITLKMMESFGIRGIEVAGNVISIPGNQQYMREQSYYVESDASSASYFMAGAAITNSKLVIQGIGKHSVQGDAKFAEVMKLMGAKIQIDDDSMTVYGREGELKGIDCDLNHIPDAAMTIAVAAVFGKGRTTIRNIGNWRIKETDRLSAMATELRKIGAEVEEGEDYISILPPDIHTHAKIETYNDHRMAMCFSLLGLTAEGVTILDPNCCAKTYPQFFEDFQSVFT